MIKAKSPNKPANSQLTTERIFLAEELRADGDDSSEYVLAILTTEKAEAKAYRRAETVANANQARLIACHDGELYYRVVRA